MVRCSLYFTEIIVSSTKHRIPKLTRSPIPIIADNITKNKIDQIVYMINHCINNYKSSFPDEKHLGKSPKKMGLEKNPYSSFLQYFWAMDFFGLAPVGFCAEQSLKFYANGWRMHFKSVYYFQRIFNSKYPRWVSSRFFLFLFFIKIDPHHRFSWPTSHPPFSRII